jgi:hypothetical protein
MAAYGTAVLVAVTVAVLVTPRAVSAHLPYPDPSLPVATRVSQLMATMTLDEKIGQMTQAERANVSNADITRIASAATITGTIQYRIDSTTGTVIASVPVSNTGGWQTWTSSTVNLTGAATGVRTLYITFTTNGTGDFVNLNWLQFNH